MAGLDALPATGRLAHLVHALAADSSLIARALERLRTRYDAIVLDLPPSLSRLTVAALAAADGIVIPVTASLAGLHGLAGFRDWLASFRFDRTITAPVWGVLLPRPTWMRKGGWGPGVDGRYLVRQLGTISGRGGEFAVAIAAIVSPR